MAIKIQLKVQFDTKVVKNVNPFQNQIVDRIVKKKTNSARKGKGFTFF